MLPSIKLLNTKSCSLSSLISASVHLEISSSSQKLCFLSYSCCTPKKKPHRNNYILLRAQTTYFYNSILLSDCVGWQLLHSTVKKKCIIPHSSQHFFYYYYFLFYYSQTWSIEPYNMYHGTMDYQPASLKFSSSCCPRKDKSLQYLSFLDNPRWQTLSYSYQGTILRPLEIWGLNDIFNSLHMA